MTPGPVEEVGKVAGNFVDAMKTQPLALALALMNIGLLLLFYYIAAAISERRAHEFDLMMAQNEKTNQLLYNCLPRGEKQ